MFTNVNVKYGGEDDVAAGVYHDRGMREAPGRSEGVLRQRQVGPNVGAKGCRKRNLKLKVGDTRKTSFTSDPPPPAPFYE